MIPIYLLCYTGDIERTKRLTAAFFKITKIVCLYRKVKICWDVCNFTTDAEDFCSCRFTDIDYPFGIFKLFFFKLTRGVVLFLNWSIVEDIKVLFLPSGGNISFSYCLSVINVYTRNSLELHLKCEFLKTLDACLLPCDLSNLHIGPIRSTVTSYSFIFFGHMFLRGKVGNYNNRLYHRLKRLCNLKIPMG